MNIEISDTELQLGADGLYEKLLAKFAEKQAQDQKHDAVISRLNWCYANRPDWSFVYIYPNHGNRKVFNSETFHAFFSEGYFCRERFVHKLADPKWNDAIWRSDAFEGVDRLLDKWPIALPEPRITYLNQIVVCDLRVSVTDGLITDNDFQTLRWPTDGIMTDKIRAILLKMRDLIGCNSPLVYTTSEPFMKQLLDNYIREDKRRELRKREEEHQDRMAESMRKYNEWKVERKRSAGWNRAKRGDAVEMQLMAAVGQLTKGNKK